MPNKECSTRTHELVLSEHEKMILTFKEETKKAVEWLSKQVKKQDKQKA